MKFETNIDHIQSIFSRVFVFLYGKFFAYKDFIGQQICLRMQAHLKEVSKLGSNENVYLKLKNDVENFALECQKMSIMENDEFRSNHPKTHGINFLTSKS